MLDGPCGLWLVAEPAATIAIREIRGSGLGLGLASGNQEVRKSNIHEPAVKPQ